MLRQLNFWLWIIFWVYWFSSAFQAKRDAKVFMRNRLRFGLPLIIILIALTVGGNKSLNRLATTSRPKDLVWIGFAAFLAGLAICIWARLNLGRNWGMPMTLKKDPELVTSGPYRYVRHPIYSGLLLAILGTVFVNGYQFIVALIFAAAYFGISMVTEEQILTKEFPKAYPEYKKHSKMFIPFIL